jgi:hypothetical protein
MMIMPTRNAARSAISLIAVVALLFCQAVWAGMLPSERLAAGMSHAFGVEAAAPTCHDLGGTDVPGNAAPSPCDSAQLPSDEVKLPVVASAVMVVASLLLIAPEFESLPLRIELAHPAGVPPPLRLLHCRFRN